MAEHLEFTDDTEITFATQRFEKSRLEDLDLVSEIECEDGKVVSCKFDIAELTHVTLNYNAMEEQRYEWRRRNYEITGAQLER